MLEVNNTPTQEEINGREERCCYCTYVDCVDGFCDKHGTYCWLISECDDFEWI